MDDAGPATVDRHHGLPVLALPRYVLFPHTLEPLTVLGEGLVPMLDSCLADRRLLVVIRESPGGRAGGEIGGLGRVVSDRRSRSGQTTLFVHCLERVRIIREVSGSPWRVVDVEGLPDHPAISGEALAGAVGRLSALATNLARELGAAGGALSRVISSTRDPEMLTHRLASLVAGDAAERQHLLETTSSLVRCHALEACLQERLLEAGPAVEGWIN